MQNLDNNGSLFIVAAPSGAGKTSIVKELIKNLDKVETSISHTTREKRPLETNGVDYFFISDQEFRKMIKNGEFIEYAHVFNNFYGTSVTQIDARLKSGIDVVLDIDWQGAQQIKRLFPSSVGVFILPPSLDALQERLHSRAQDKVEVIKKRMQEAQSEMSHYAEFDYLIVNDDFSRAVSELISIVKSKRLTIQRQIPIYKDLLSLLTA
jgi:guanylate kinase